MPVPAPFAAAVPTWLDKEVMVLVCSLLAAMIPVVWAMAQFLNRVAWKRVHELQARVRELEAQIDGKDGAEVRLLKVRLLHAEGERDAAQARVVEVQAERDEALATADRHYKGAETLRAERDEFETERDESREVLRGEQLRIKNAVQRDGAIWEDRVMVKNAVEFRPLDPEVRRTPVISMLNLKGGVGKTTATANLGAALSARGYRVLLIDLDLQGSLTGMFLSDREQKQAFDEERLVGNFLNSAFDVADRELEDRNLMTYARPILSFPTKSMVVPTTDSQAYAEMNLSVRWFLRDAKKDPRFLLRRELQYARVTGRFDVVLIDCPPLINVSCVNALAASDYVLIPVMPTAQSTTRVPVLLERIKEFQRHLNSELEVLGVFANRPRGTDLTADEENKLSLLRAKAHDAMGYQVPVFDTFIRASAEFRDIEDERRTLRPDDPMFLPFLALAKEVESHLPMFCRPVPAAKAVAGGVPS